MRRRWHLSGRMRVFFLIPFGVFIFSGTLGYFLVNLSLQRSYKSIESSFEKEGGDLHEYALNKSTEYLQALYDTRVLFSVTGGVSRSDFGQQNNTSNLKAKYPGLSMVGYASKVETSNSGDFILSVRGDKTVNPVGYPDYRISPTKSSGYYLPITYLEPYAKDMMGVDLFSMTNVSAAVQKSIDTGTPAMTGKVRLYGDRDGFLTVAALYQPGANISTVDTRRSALTGMIFTGFKSYEIFPVLLEKSTIDPQVGIEVYTGESVNLANLLYSTTDTCNATCENDYKNPLTFVKLPWSSSGTMTLDVLDVKWTVKLTASANYVVAHLGIWPMITFFASLLMVIALTTTSAIVAVRRFGSRSAGETEKLA